MQSMAAAHLGAPKILKFLCLCSGTHRVMAHLMILYGFCAPAPEVRYCWRTQDLVKNGHTLQTGGSPKQYI